jgi:DNA-binding transcriptional MerR regulator
MAPSTGMRLDDLAQRSGVASTTIRLYQNRGLLAGPDLVGRTGYYDDRHLVRLRLISRLQHDGFSLAGIARLLESWEQGLDLADVVGVEEQLDALLTRRHEIVLTPAELAERLPADALSADLLQRATALGVIAPTDDGRFRIPDQRFLDIGSALADLGIPSDVILDEWEALVATTDGVADRFVGLFEQYLLPDDWRKDLDGDHVRELAATLARLHQLAGQVLATALDSSIAKVGSQRLGELLPDAPEQE